MAETIVIILCKEVRLPKLGNFSNFTADTGLTRAPDDSTINSMCRQKAEDNYAVPVFFCTS